MKELEISNEEVKEILRESAKNKTIHISLFFPQDASLSKEKILSIKESRKEKLGKILRTKTGKKRYAKFIK